MGRRRCRGGHDYGKYFWKLGHTVPMWGEGVPMGLSHKSFLQVLTKLDNLMFLTFCLVKIFKKKLI